MPEPVLERVCVSYEVCIWDPARWAPLPQTADEAVDVMERLTGVADVWNSRLGDFGVALEQRYDAEPARVRGAGGLEAFWGCNPRVSTAECRTALYRMSLPEEGCSPQLAHVVEAAAAHGLIVFDDETGMCFLPDGSIFPEDMRELWASELASLKLVPRDPAEPAADGRTLLQRIAFELFESIGRGESRH